MPSDLLILVQAAATRGWCSRLEPALRACTLDLASHFCPRQWLAASAVIFVIVPCLLAASCFSPHRGSFQILPQSPAYLLRSPDSRETPFPEILRSYNGFERGQKWIDLRPLMELRIENAYYEKGASRRGLEGFLGTEVARYEVARHGLQLLSFQPMANRPEGDIPVQLLISSGQTKFSYQRLYFEIFLRTKNVHGSVLLAADSIPELNRLAAQLDRPETVCNATSSQCAVFPEACSVSVEMKVFVNGKAQSMVWGSLLSSVVTDSTRVLQLERLYEGKLTPIAINVEDKNELKLPLLPGDHIISR